MLRQLEIRNLAIVESISLDLQEGLTIFTGETGAGKSILINALGLILGKRGDSKAIRAGAKTAEVTVVIDISKTPETTKQLHALEIRHEQEIFLRRTINIEGRSKAYINNTPVPIQTLGELGRQCIDIHGQHAHQSLLKQPTQRNNLDHFGGYLELVKQVEQAYDEWQAVNTELSKIKGNEAADAKISLLTYQIEEIEQLTTTTNTYLAICERHNRLANVDKILLILRTSLDSIADEENSLLNRLRQIEKDVSTINQSTTAYEALNQFLELARIQLDEAKDELKALITDTETNPAELAELDKQLETYHDLARRHKIPPQTLATYLAELKQQLNQIKNNLASIELLTTKQQKTLEHYRQLAKNLHQERQRVAPAFSAQVSQKLHEMGMSNAQLEAQIEYDGEQLPSPSGDDVVKFVGTMNLGHEYLPLNKFVSGGELSRIGLAIKITVLNDYDISTMIFDEVDSGIGGKAADVVGQLLNRLAKQHQILCVTHLAQIAAIADNHFQVDKDIHDNQAVAEVSALTPEERVDEIARMLSGNNTSEKSLSHAREMLHLAEAKS